MRLCALRVFIGAPFYTVHVPEKAAIRLTDAEPILKKGLTQLTGNE